MNRNPKVSIIIPVYNVEKYIDECLESVKKQTFSDYEVIIVNDGSTDGSIDAINKIIDKFDNIKIINQSNKGLSVARNVGVDNASGDYFFFLDSDDFILPDTIEKLYNACINNHCDLGICGVRIFGDGKSTSYILYPKEEKIISSTEWLKLVMSGRAFSWSWNKLYKRDIWKSNNIAFPIGKYYEDIALSFEILRFYDKIAIVNLPLYQYRLRTGSIISTFSEKKMGDFISQSAQALRIAEELLKGGSDDEEIRQFLNAYLGFQWTEATAMALNLNIGKKRIDLIIEKLGNPSLMDVIRNPKLLLKSKVRFLYYYLQFLLKK